MRDLATIGKALTWIGISLLASCAGIMVICGIALAPAKAMQVVTWAAGTGVVALMVAFAILAFSSDEPQQ